MADRKKKRPYTLSEKARAQRRGAAYKTGEHAQLAVHRLGHPCRADLCPNGGPCDAKRAVEAEGGALDTCLVDFASHPEVVAAFEAAMHSGDLSGLISLRAMLLGSSATLAISEAGRLLEDGLASRVVTVGPDGQETSREVVNPRAKPFFELLRVVGATADQQQLTAKSQGEGRLAQAQASGMEWMRRMLEATEGRPADGDPAEHEGEA